MSEAPSYQPIAHHFCGQMQPHAAHTWETPPAYGSATFISTYQCAGLAPTTDRPGDGDEVREVGGRG